jgi:hypothetical protein
MECSRNNNVDLYDEVSFLLFSLFHDSLKIASEIPWVRKRRHISIPKVAVDGLMVSVLAIGPKVRGFKPGRGRWILRAIKSAARLPSERKQSRRTHVVDLRHVKKPYEHNRCSSAKFSAHVSHPRFTCFVTRCLLALLTDVPGGRIMVARTSLIVGLITPHLTYLS